MSETAVYNAWTDEQWLALMVLTAPYKEFPSEGQWNAITVEHNKMFNLKRNRRTVMAAFNRIRTALRMVQNKRMWALVMSNQHLFAERPRGGDQRPKKSRSKVAARVDRLEAQLDEVAGNVNYRVDRLDTQIAEVADNVSLILENLTKGG